MDLIKSLVRILLPIACLGCGGAWAETVVLKCAKANGEMYFANTCGDDGVLTTLALREITLLDPVPEDPVQGLLDHYAQLYPELRLTLRQVWGQVAGLIE